MRAGNGRSSDGMQGLAPPESLRLEIYGLANADLSFLSIPSLRLPSLVTVIVPVQTSWPLHIIQPCIHALHRRVLRCANIPPANPSRHSPISYSSITSILHALMCCVSLGPISRPPLLVHPCLDIVPRPSPAPSSCRFHPTTQGLLYSDRDEEESDNDESKAARHPAV